MADSSGDELDSPLIQGWFEVGKFHFQVVLTHDALEWTTDIRAAKKNSSHRLTYEEILSIRGMHDTLTNETVGFDICYIKKDKRRLRRANVQFMGAAKACEEWMVLIHRKLLEVVDRPRRVLVLINPVSGQHIIRQSPSIKTFESLVQPIFEEAGIKITELVTGEARQADKILLDFDLSSIDSVVLIGGDGFYHEAVNGLLRRQLIDAGLDQNDVNAKIERCNIPIGVIPAGTGNGVAETCFGIDDQETAILGIILGKKSHMNVFGVYESKQLLSFASLMVGYGFWADIASYTDNKRFMGILRYAVALLDFGFFRSQRVTDLTIEYLKAEPVTSNGASSNGRTGDLHPASLKKPSKRLVWMRQTGAYVAMVCFAMDILSYLDPRRKLDLKNTTVVFNKPCSRLKTLKFLFGLVNKDVGVLKLDNVEHEFVRGVKVTINNPNGPESERGRKERLLNLDGELFTLKGLSFEIRLHTEVMTVFSTIHSL